jgi:hypothetical protein
MAAMPGANPMHSEKPAAEGASRRAVSVAISGSARPAAAAPIWPPAVRGASTMGQLLSLTSALSGLLLCVAESRYEGRLAGP